MAAVAQPNPTTPITATAIEHLAAVLEPGEKI
jgi:hypothetical protein